MSTWVSSQTHIHLCDEHLDHWEGPPVAFSQITGQKRGKQCRKLKVPGAWHTPLTLVLRKQNKENSQEFEGTLVYSANSRPGSETLPQGEMGQGQERWLGD